MCGCVAGMGRDQGLSWLRPGTTSKDGMGSVAGFGYIVGASASLGCIYSCMA